MPQWSSRLLSPSTRNQPGPDTVVGASPGRVPSRIAATEILGNASSIPHAQYSRDAIATGNLASSGSGSRRATSHGRSMSHPFPSFFSGKKKRHEEALVSGNDSDEDKVSQMARRSNPQGVSAKQKVPDKELTTGKCMTCDSMVRWPKELSVFRCTVCLTINDLKPILLETRRRAGHRIRVPGNAGTNSGSRFPHGVALSLERTRIIIDQCVTTYLLERLKHEDSFPSSPAQSPPLSQGSNEGVAGNGDEQADDFCLDEGAVESNSTTGPIHLSGRPIDENLPSRVKLSFDVLQSESHIYSRSTPGNFLDAHMERRDIHNNSVTDRSKKGSLTHHSRSGSEAAAQQTQMITMKNIFKPLEDYLVAAFGSFECVNTSFSTVRPSVTSRAASEGAKHVVPTPPPVERSSRAETPMSEMDAKTLLLGDFAENGSWWTGNRTDLRSPERWRTQRGPGDSVHESNELVTLKSPRVDWNDANEWYYSVLNAGRWWRKRFHLLMESDVHILQLRHPSDTELDEIDDEIMEAQFHAQRVLLKATESLLKRPSRPLSEPNDLRFLLVILANPLLYPAPPNTTGKDKSQSRSRSREARKNQHKAISLDVQRPRYHSPSPAKSNPPKGSSGQHSGIIKRVLGLLSNVSNECHHHLVSWFARFSDNQFQRTTDLIGSFVTYRLLRQQGRKRDIEQDPTVGLIPSISGSGSSSAALHAALGISGGGTRKADGKVKAVVYNDDWQIKAAARVMALLFSANNSGMVRRGDGRSIAGLEGEYSAGLVAREKAHYHGQIIPTSDFYNTLLDCSDLIADFEAWESRLGKFSFCQYPFFLSIWAKIQIMEHDARRQMEVKAREAFFDSIMTRKSVNQYLVLTVRRDCLVEDSLKGVSEVVGTGGEEIKKGLRITFKGEEGIDAGGLRKEWFLLLVRDVFNPEHGMFTYDEDSQFCYFNPNSFETTDQFFLVGVVLGLAIYNSTILDVALPPFAFRKLLAAGPAPIPGATSHAKPLMTYSLEDLAEYRPALANGLRQLLEYDGDVESTFCRDFVADVDRYGQSSQVPLCPDGEKRPVTNSNRREFVDHYVRYLLDTAVTRQFEPFKRGFFTVCGGNALSLFRPEEIELLIRGSDEALDIASLRAVSVCENWGLDKAADTEPVVQWFWETFIAAKPSDQRKLLGFITGSDRIPAMGTTNLVIKLSCLGDDSMRYPVARTCFNQLSLWRYSSKQKLERMLWRAVHESEGFGLK